MLAGRRPSLALALASLPLLAACKLGPLGSSETVGPWQEVHQIDVSLLESCPPQFVVRVAGGTGACDTVLPPRLGRSGPAIVIAIDVRTASGICTAQLLHHEEAVSLGTLEPGDYTVRVPSRFGEKTASFRVPSCDSSRNPA